MGRTDPPRNAVALGRAQRVRRHSGRPRQPARPALPRSGRQTPQRGDPGARPPRHGVRHPLPSASRSPRRSATSTGTGSTASCLDRCPTDRDELPAMRRIGRRRCGPLRDGAHLVLGHGTHPAPRLRGGRRPAGHLQRPLDATTAGRRWRNGPPTTRPSGSATWSTACRARIWRRPCGSPAGRARAPSTSRTAPTGRAAKADTSIHSRRCPATGTKLSRGSDRYLGMRGRVAVLRREQPY